MITSLLDEVCDGYSNSRNDDGGKKKRGGDLNHDNLMARVTEQQILILLDEGLGEGRPSLRTTLDLLGCLGRDQLKKSGCCRHSFIPPIEVITLSKGYFICMIEDPWKNIMCC